jgi:5-hydroxyisourate hydrolase-like protein (transthyretin family)
VECIEKIEERKWARFKTTVTNQDGKVVVTGVATVIPPAS